MSFVQRALFRCSPAARAVMPRMRFFASEHGIGSPQATFIAKSEVSTRVLDTVKRFPKVDANKVTGTSSFSNDLGLDSLDQVELVMSLEDEFKVEIPDADAEKIQSIDDAIKYIAAHPSAL